MASMTSVCANTEMPMFGSTTLICLIYFHLQPSSKIKFSVFMAVFRLILRRLSKLDKLIDKSKCHTRVLCVICFGPIQTTGTVGAFHHAGPVLRLDKTYLNSSTTRTTLSSSRERINSWWMGTTGRTKNKSWQFSALLITATDAVTRLELWKLMSRWIIIS